MRISVETSAQVTIACAHEARTKTRIISENHEMQIPDGMCNVTSGMKKSHFWIQEIEKFKS